ncbi:MAG: hypothetical protein DI568_00100 [Sphingomonas sp.]|nr:MAG: hypothetical protein DI568_00100 [Sphingomonas sp.]
MNWMIAAPLGAALSVAVPGTLSAQTPPTAAAPDTPTAPVTEACEAPKPKKKGPGLGNVLRSARAAGLISGLAGHAGSNGHLVNSVANTAINASTMVDTGQAVAKAGNRSC